MSDKFYCMYCGFKESTIQMLTSDSYSCLKNPNSKHHALYDAKEKDSYSCKYCGRKDSTIANLSSCQCDNSPSKYHIPSIN